MALQIITCHEKGFDFYTPSQFSTNFFELLPPEMTNKT